MILIHEDDTSDFLYNPFNVVYVLPNVSTPAAHLRTIVVTAESRVLTVARQSRSLVPPVELRTFPTIEPPQ